MKVLINVPDLKRPGGVAVLFATLKMEKYIPNISIFVLHNKLPAFIRIPLKYIEFAIKLNKIDVVHINPSLNRNSFIRDSFYAWLTIFFKKKLIVYWHGWEDSFEEKLKNSIILNGIAKYSFLKAQSCIVIGSIFERKLRALGFTNNIYIETNSAEIKKNNKIKPIVIQPEQQIRILFLSRLEVNKGIYIAIETLKLLNKHTNRFKLIIAGSGTEEESIVRIASTNIDIEWVGYVRGRSKHNILSSAQIMLLPSYTEGMPISLLEGMLYGMPIISRPIGGIVDIITNKKNGYLIDSLLPEDYEKTIIDLVNNSVLFNQISKNNIKLSEKFHPDRVRERLLDIYKNVFEDKIH